MHACGHDGYAVGAAKLLAADSGYSPFGHSTPAILAMPA
jgi:hypothetical protein